MNKLAIALIGLTLIGGGVLAADKTAAGKGSQEVIIGNYLYNAPGGVAFIVDNGAAFAFNVGWGGTPGMAAPDNSIHKVTFQQDGANIHFDWGKHGDSVVARVSADKQVAVSIKATATWPRFKTDYTLSADRKSCMAEAKLADGSVVKWQLLTQPAPVNVTDADKEVSLFVQISPAKPVMIVAGTGELPAFDDANSILDTAEKAYAKRRASASGDWGDFVAAITNNLNNSRLYCSDNKLVAHTVSRGWCPNPDRVVYFCWDSFFNGLLASIEDPETGRNTVRAILGHQTEEGLIPNFANWEFAGNQDSKDRSQPPVGSMCVWKMHQRWPDKAFLAEVYPKLVKWHNWWLSARDGNKNGLLEWGSSTGDLQGALWETGWDDTPAFTGAKMVGSNMDVDAVDLNSLWATDAEHLALIADAIGKKDDAKHFKAEHAEMVKRINDRLWNDDLGLYCNRKWDGEFITRLTPMCFYPMMAGVPNKARAARMLQVLTDKSKFWGEWMLPTVAYDDPAWPQQHYWRGKVWAPTNYLVFQGVKRYASPDQIVEYARKSVKLFMTNWTARGVCSENYLSTNGTPSSDPHYTWGALLNLIGIEAICDIRPDGKITTGSGFTESLQLSNLPIAGKMHCVSVKAGKVRVE